MNRPIPRSVSPRWLSAARFLPGRLATGMVLLPGLLLVLVAGTSSSRAAGAVYWDYPGTYPFKDLTLEGTALNAAGNLVAGLAAEKLLADGPEVVWQVVVDEQGGLYAATGHQGQIWHIDSKGKATVMARLPEPEIFCLLKVGQDLFAGAGPDGLLYRVRKNAEPEVWADLPEAYIWALTAGKQGRIYVAAGSPAAVYVVTERLQARRLATLPATHALALMLDGDNALWVATQGPGLIYCLDPAQGARADQPVKPRVVYEAAQSEIRQLVTGGPGGDRFFLAISRQPIGDEESSVPSGDPDVQVAPQSGGGTDKKVPSAALYHLADDGLATPVWSGDQPLLAVAWTQKWGWLAAGMMDPKQSRASLLVLDPPQNARPVATWPSGDGMSLLVHRQKNDHEVVLVSLGRPGGVLRLTDRSTEAAVATCQPLDGKAPVRWGRLRWEGEVAKGGQLRWSVRCGPRADPDETWSDWSDPWDEVDHALELPPSRFAQWRVEMKGHEEGTFLSAVTVSAYAPNVAPVIRNFTLQPEGHVDTGGLMARDDNVTETLRGGLRVEYSVTSQQDHRASLFQAAPVRPVRTFTWQTSDPNDDHLLHQLAYQRVGQDGWRSLGPETVEPIGSWDTSTVPDGLYVVRLSVSDRLDNPGGQGLVATRLLPPFLVDHTPPAIRDFQVRRTPEGFVVSFQAADRGCPLAEAWIELPDGSTERLDPRDGICDSLQESFETTYEFPKPDQPPLSGPWRVRAAVSDRLGNVVIAEGEVR